MTNNTTESDLISLFPDNTDNLISANNLRTCINGTFSNLETKIIKINSSSDLPLNTNIFEGSLVVIYGLQDRGIYLSLVNQPQLLDNLIKL